MRSRPATSTRTIPRAGMALLVGVAACSSASTDLPWGGGTPTSDASPADGANTTGDAAADAAQVATGGDASMPSVDGGSPPPQPDAAAPLDAPVQAPPGWTLTWSDEFNGPDGSPADPTKWQNEVGGGGWGNKEREYYTDGAANAVVQGGNLVITAKPDGASQYMCWYGPCEYTSARLNTAAAFSQKYGRFEARVQVPFGQGLWPAFWLLGVDIPNVGWPKCGEIDVVENVGFQPATAWGSLHSVNFNATTGYMTQGMAHLSDAFHTFAVEWEQTAIRFYVDDQLYETRVPAEATNAGGTWPFDHPFFILLNVAVGGMWPGNPDGTTTFPQTMKVDWVRVYSKT